MFGVFFITSPLPLSAREGQKRDGWGEREL